MGKCQLDRFRKRHSPLQIVRTRQGESARKSAIDCSATETYFDAIAALVVPHDRPPDCIYNMDESRFAVDISQSSRVLFNIRKKSSWKIGIERQEWMTAIENVSASGIPLLPLVIFQTTRTNIA